MTLDPAHIAHAAAIGIGATAITDLWALLLNRAYGVPAANYCLVGRWLAHMPEGVFRHASIAAAPRKTAECAAGWIAHYAIGIAFALALLILAPAQWLQAPTLLPALAVGLATVAFPFLLMQPAFGLGIAAAKTPAPAQARLRSLMTHAVFGLGLYAAARILGAAAG